MTAYYNAKVIYRIGEIRLEHKLHQTPMGRDMWGCYLAFDILLVTGDKRMEFICSSQNAERYTVSNKKGHALKVKGRKPLYCRWIGWDKGITIQDLTETLLYKDLEARRQQLIESVESAHKTQ